MTKYSIAAAALALAMSSGFAFAQDSPDASALPVIKNGQCYDDAQAAKPSDNQQACRAALGKNDTTGSIAKPPGNPPTSGG